MATGDRPEGGSPEPIYPIPLTPELAAFLMEQGRHAGITQATNEGTAYILKAPAFEIARAHEAAPMLVRHQLFGLPTAPVIRTVLTLYDYPHEPLRFESFIDIAIHDQRALLPSSGIPSLMIVNCRGRMDALPLPLTQYK